MSTRQVSHFQIKKKKARNEEKVKAKGEKKIKFHKISIYMSEARSHNENLYLSSLSQVVVVKTRLTGEKVFVPLKTPFPSDLENNRTGIS